MPNRDPPVLPPGMDRRGFLRTTAGGAAAIAAAALLPAGCARDYPQAERDGATLHALSAKEYATLRAAAEALLVDVPVEPGVIAAGVDRELALVGDPVRADMKTVLQLMQHGTVLAGRPRRFTALSIDARRAVLASWADSRFNLRRAAYQALRGFVVYFAYSDDRTRSITRFPGPWPERLEIAVAPVDFGEIA